jgi:MFS family permease
MSATITVTDESTFESRGAPRDDQTTAHPVPGRPSSPLEVDENAPGPPATSADDDETRYPTGRKMLVLSAALAILNISVGLDTSIVAVALPAMSDEFKSLADVVWYATALRLTLCAFLFLFGKAYTLFKVKPLFVGSVITYEVGIILCTFAPSSKAFIIGRAITGFGVAGILGGMFAMLTRAFPLKKRPMVGGMLGGVETVASLAAPLVGGALIDGWTWRACFGINMPLGVLGLVGVFYLEEMPPGSRAGVAAGVAETKSWREQLAQLDLLGTAVFVPSLVCLLLALEFGTASFGWSDPRVIVLFVVFGTLLGVFAWIQHKQQDKATIPPRILKNRNILAGAWFSSCCNATLAVTEYYLSIYFQGVRGFSAFQAGIYALPMIIGMCAASVISGSLTSRLGYYVPYMYFTTLVAPIAAGLLTTVNLNTDLAKLLAYQGLLGFAIGSGLMVPQYAAQTVLDQKEVTIGYAVVQFGSQLGPVVYLSASAALFTNRLEEEIHKYSPTTDVAALNNAGLSDIRKIVGAARLGDVLLGYDAAVVQTLYLPLALTCMTIFGSLAMQWRSVKKKQT